MLPSDVVIIRYVVVLVLEIHPSIEIFLHPTMDHHFDLLHCGCEWVIFGECLLVVGKPIGLVELYGFSTVRI